MDEVKYDIISFFDECRWKEKENYGECNYSAKIKKDDYENKLLIHWLLYITDRQMNFKQIWDIGGYVFSKLVLEYNKKIKEGQEAVTKQILNYKEKDANKTFFVNKGKKDKDTEYSFVAKIENNEEQLKKIQKYKSSYDKNFVYFKSRFYTADFLCIYKTLYILEKYYNGSFEKYIRTIIEKIKEKNSKNIVKGIALGLYSLTYENDKNKKDYIIPKQKEEAREQYLKRVISTEFKNPLEEQIDENFNKYDKRLWCAFRDYIKSKRYRPLFEKIIKDKQIGKLLFSEEAESYLELPGDVWNNNPQFSRCLFEEYDIEREQYKYTLNEKIKTTKKFNVFLRDIYQKKTGITERVEWNPEKFDITFDFVPRMCTAENCDICPFNVVKKGIKMEDLKRICKDGQGNDYCTVALICCGYRVKCSEMKENGECKLMKKLKFIKK